MRTIYGIVDPTDGEIHYVGATRTPLEPYLKGRLTYAARDLQCSQWKRTPRDRWLRRLLDQGLRPSIVALHKVDDAVWRDAERVTIKELAALGCPLTNTHAGGGGGT